MSQPRLPQLILGYFSVKSARWRAATDDDERYVYAAAL